MILLDDLKLELNSFRKELDELAEVLNIKAAKEEVESLQAQATAEGFWDDLENSQKVLQKTKQLENKIAGYQRMENKLEDLFTMLELCMEEEDEDMQNEIVSEMAAFKQALEDKNLETLLSDEYDSHNAILTCPYPGITDLIRKLKDDGILTAVVSNKPDNSVVQLAEDYFGGQFDLAIGETDGIARKPAPDMNYLALRKLGVDVKDAVYIGDTEIDIRTAANTGMDLIMVEWGFRPKALLQSLGAEVFVSTADEIYSIIRAQNTKIDEIVLICERKIGNG